MGISDLSDQHFVSGCPKDFAKELGYEGIMNLLRIICEAYKNLLAREKINSTAEETAITEELYVEIYKICKSSNVSLIPIHEKSHERKEEGRGRTPAIDFCFRDDWERDSYFGAECKRLEENNPRLCDLYIKNGICRYLSGKYGEKCSAGSMIGYILMGNTKNVIDEVKIKVNNLPNIFSKMQKAEDVNNWFTEHYTSIHDRETVISPFQIHHLFFSFTN